MRAALVTSFDTPPRCEEVPEPQATGETEAVVDVLAVGLHPRVRSQANGSHYTSTDELPIVPGIDGVGRLQDGQLVYFVLPDTPHGAMAERTVIDRRRSVPIPDDCDPTLLAAAMNPAMSSWVGLRRRADFRPGQSVLVLGATGNAGQLAVQVAKHLGASYVVGAGRDPEALSLLPSLGADTTVSLADDADATRGLAEAAEVDVVVDYLWSTPTERAMPALLRARTDRSRTLTWLQVGSVAGPTMALPSAALRSAALQVVGSGQGSVSTSGILAELPELAAEVSRGSFAVRPIVTRLTEIEETWTTPVPTGHRIVVVP